MSYVHKKSAGMAERGISSDADGHIRGADGSYSVPLIPLQSLGRPPNQLNQSLTKSLLPAHTFTEMLPNISMLRFTHIDSVNIYFLVFLCYYFG